MTELLSSEEHGAGQGPAVQSAVSWPQRPGWFAEGDRVASSHVDTRTGDIVQRHGTVVQSDYRYNTDIGVQWDPDREYPRGSRGIWRAGPLDNLTRPERDRVTNLAWRLDDGLVDDGEVDE